MPRYYTIKHRNLQGSWSITEFQISTETRQGPTISATFRWSDHEALAKGLGGASAAVLDQLLADGYEGTYAAAYEAAVALSEDPCIRYTGMDC